MYCRLCGLPDYEHPRSLNHHAFDRDDRPDFRSPASHAIAAKTKALAEKKAREPRPGYGSRPYADLNSSELNATLGRALGTPGGYVDATAFGDTARTYLLHSPKDALVSTSNATMKDAYGDLITTSNTVRMPSTGQEWVLEDTYEWSDGQATRVQATKVIEGGLKPESDIVWLRRRIAEICWVPA